MLCLNKLKSTMNFAKFNPISLKLFQLALQYEKIHNKSIMKNIFTKNVWIPRNNFLMSIALGFIWPIKKTNKEIVENIQAQKQPSILEVSDILFEKSQYDECLKLLSESKDKDVEIQWRICRVLYNMAKQKKYDKTQQQGFILDAYDIILKLVNANQDHYAVHKWYALLLDAKSSQDGIRERIKQLENVKKHMDLAVTLNPNDATTLYMLGEWCFQITEMPWHQRKIAEVLFAAPPHSTYDDALEYFLRAESVQPRFYSMNLLRLGYCYLKLQKEDQAKYYLKLAASYPAKSNDDHHANKEATELLKKLKST